MISEPAHPQFSASLSTLETISGDVRASNITLEERIMLNGHVTGGQNTAGVSVLHLPQKHVIEDFQTFRARHKGKPQVDIRPWSDNDLAMNQVISGV